MATSNSIPSAAQALELARSGDMAGAQAMLQAAAAYNAAPVAPPSQYDYGPFLPPSYVPPTAPPVTAPPAAEPTLYIGSQPTSYSTTTTAAPPVAPVVDTNPPAVQQTQPAAAVTYQQAIAFRDSPIGSQIPRIERLLRPSNWNNLNGDLKSKYLKEIGEAINDPIKYSSDRLKEDAASYLVFQNIPGGGGTAKAEARDLKSNIDKYVTFLQNNGQSQAAIESIVTKGSIEGAKRLEEQVDRMSDVSVIDRIADFGLQVGLATATAGLSLPAQIGVNAALQLANDANPADIVRNVVATITANSLTYGIPGIESSNIIPKTLNEINTAIANLAPNTISPTVASALINAERQAVAALITKQDVAQNALAGAAGGAIADIAKLGFDDPLTQKAIGEYAKYNALGMSPVDAALMAGVDYAGDVATQTGQKTPDISTDEQANSYYKQFEEAFSQPRTPGIGSQLGEATAELSSIGGERLTSAVPGGIGTDQPLFDGSEFSVGVNQQAGPVKNIIVEGKTYQTRDITDASGTTTYYFDPIDKKVTARPVTSVGDTAGGTEIKTLAPVEVTGDKTFTPIDVSSGSFNKFSPTDLTTKQPIIIGGGKGGSGGSNVPIKPGISGVAGGGSTTGAIDTGGAGGGGAATGATTGGGGVATGAATGATTGATSGAVSGVTPAEEDGLSLLQRVNNGLRTDASSTGDKKLPPIEVTYEDETILNVPKLPPVEVTYEDETILKPPKIIEDTETTKKTEDTTVTKPPIEPVILDLISGNNFTKTRTRIPTTAERASMQALSQALSVGDPGEALFGSRLGRRKNVWNVESLRLKDELGG